LTQAVRKRLRPLSAVVIPGDRSEDRQRKGGS